MFTYARDGFVNDFPDLEGQVNVFVANLDGSDLTPITHGFRGYNYIEALSTDGSKALISSFRSRNRSDDPNAILYLIDLNSTEKEPIQIVQGFSQYSYSPAAGWTNDSKIVYLGKGEKGYGIYVANAGGSEPTKIDATIKTPERILAIDDQRVYWSHGEHKRYGDMSGDFTAVWWTNIDGSEQGQLEVEGRQIEFFGRSYAFSPDSGKLAWLPSDPGPQCNTIARLNALSIEERNKVCDLLYVVDLPDIENVIKIPSSYPMALFKRTVALVGAKKSGGVSYYFTGMIWGADSLKLYMSHRFEGGDIVLDWAYVEPFEKNAEFTWLENLPSLGGIHGFSPDGRQVFVSEVNSEGTRQYALIDLDTMTVDDTFLDKFNRDAIYDVYLLP